LPPLVSRKKGCSTPAEGKRLTGKKAPPTLRVALPEANGILAEQANNLEANKVDPHTLGPAHGNVAQPGPGRTAEGTGAQDTANTSTRNTAHQHSNMLLPDLRPSTTHAPTGRLYNRHQSGGDGERLLSTEQNHGPTPVRIDWSQPQAPEQSFTGTSRPAPQAPRPSALPSLRPSSSTGDFVVDSSSDWWRREARR